jgi:hypothetical protein
MTCVVDASKSFKKLNEIVAHLQAKSGYGIRISKPRGTECKKNIKMKKELTLIIIIDVIFVVFIFNWFRHLIIFLNEKFIKYIM